MSILVYANTDKGQIHKSALEATSYAAQIAEKQNDTVVAVTSSNADNASELGKYGATKVLQMQSDSLQDFQPHLIAKGLKQIAENESASLIVFSHDLSGKSIAPMLSALMGAGIVTGAVALPNLEDGFTVKKAVFSGKAFANVKINTDKKIIGLMPNSMEKIINEKDVSVENVNVDLESSRLKVIEQKFASTDIPLTEAETVVSAGRGMKGPENWSMVEELAKLLGAATACSRPVADMDWRPHHEHVGQTGIAIRPNLYIAIGISGAIQHLAGVNQSKVIVVINTDAEAPFFKSADYGIVGDAFEVLPKLIEAAKSMNISAN